MKCLAAASSTEEHGGEDVHVDCMCKRSKLHDGQTKKPLCLEALADRERLLNKAICALSRYVSLRDLYRVHKKGAEALPVDEKAIWDHLQQRTQSLNAAIAALEQYKNLERTRKRLRRSVAPKSVSLMKRSTR